MKHENVALYDELIGRVKIRPQEKEEAKRNDKTVYDTDRTGI